MMKSRLVFMTMSLIAVLLAVSCAPADTAPPALPTVESTPATAAPTDVSAPEAPPVPTNAIMDIQVVPTSLGPDLHATDPTTVSLASDGLQLVEFFRFT
jgi:hypothetical protein